MRARAPRDYFGPRGETYDDAAAAQRGEVLLIDEGAPASRYYRWQQPPALRTTAVIGGDLLDHRALESAEVRLAMCGEDLGDRFSGSRGKPRVTIDETPEEAAGDRPSHRALA